MQAETQTKMSILGRGSMRDKQKEEELRNGDDPSYSHLKEDLHVLIEAVGPYSNLKVAAGFAEIKKMLIPPVSYSMCTAEPSGVTVTAAESQSRCIPSSCGDLCCACPLKRLMACIVS